MPGLHLVLRGRSLDDQRGWGEVWRAALALDGAQIHRCKRIQLCQVYVSNNAELHVTISQSAETGMDTGSQRWHFTLKQQQGLPWDVNPNSSVEHALGIG